jgi:hypothetical protein
MTLPADAGDLLHAYELSLPADVTTTTPVATAASTALLIDVLFEPPRDMSAQNICTGKGYPTTRQA